jgi:hypothetical protein
MRFVVLVIVVKPIHIKDMTPAEVLQAALEFREIQHAKEYATCNFNNLNAKIVSFMIERNLNFIALESDGPHSGPYLQLAKKTSTPKWADDRKDLFWGLFLHELNFNPENVATVAKCVAYQKRFIDQFEEHDLVVTTCDHLVPLETVQEMLRWKNEKDTFSGIHSVYFAKQMLEE